MYKEIAILLSAAGSPTMPGQLRCFRNNGERKIKIVGVDMVDDATIKQMVDVFYQVPPVTDSNYIDVILKICLDEHIDIYFPNISAEVTVVSKRLSDFENIGVKVSAADEKIVQILNNKLSVYEKMVEYGISVPKFYPVRTIKDFKNGCIMLNFPNRPVCLKVVNESGSRGIRIIDNNRNRYEIFAHEKPNNFFTSYEDMLSILMSTNKLEEMMLVEYLPGNEYTVDLLAEKGKVLYIEGRENIVSLMSIAQKSIVTKIESAYDICKKIIKIFDYTGNIGFDFMKDENGIPVLMDINPRLTATVSVIAAAGVSLPYLRIKQLLGESLPECHAEYGTMMVRRYGEYMATAQGDKIIF